MNFLKSFWNWLTVKDLPNSVVETPVTVKNVEPTRPTYREQNLQHSDYGKMRQQVEDLARESPSEEEIRKEWLPEPPTPDRVPRRRTSIRVQKSGAQAIEKGYGRFFRGKGKGQLPGYRRSKFAKVGMEEDDA